MEKKYVEVESRGLTLRGFLELPDASRNGRVPLLVMFHGFTGDMCEKHFLLSRLSRDIVKEGVATLRFDFGGSGESDGEFIDVTPLTEVEDGISILHYSMGLDEIDTGRLGLLGFSLGGFVATNVAARCSDLLSGLILVSPAIGTHKKMEKSLHDCGRALRGSLEVGGQFVTDGYALDPLVAAQSFEKPVSIIQGTADVAVTPDTAEKYMTAFPHASLSYVDGADHAYDRPEYFAELSSLVCAAAKCL